MAISNSRIVILGGPKTGKTTLANALGGGRSTDEVKNLGWSESSDAAAKWFDAPGPWIIEGVTAVRALRKWLEQNKGKPCDYIVWLTNPRRQLTTNQQRMSKGVDGIVATLRSTLKRRGVEFLINPRQEKLRSLVAPK